MAVARQFSTAASISKCTYGFISCQSMANAVSPAAHFFVQRAFFYRYINEDSTLTQLLAACLRRRNYTPLVAVTCIQTPSYIYERLALSSTAAKKKKIPEHSAPRSPERGVTVSPSTEHSFHSWQKR